MDMFNTAPPNVCGPTASYAHVYNIMVWPKQCMPTTIDELEVSIIDETWNIKLYQLIDHHTVMFPNYFI